MFTHGDELLASCADLPVFPLPGVVFFPHTLLPLHVFEPRYRELVADVLKGDGLLGVPLLLPGWETQYEARPTLAPTFGVGRLIRHQLLPDGRSNIVLLGLTRARLEREHAPLQAYRRVEASPLPFSPPPPALWASLLRQLARRAAQRESRDIQRLLEPERQPEELLYGLAHLLLRSPEERQQMLESNPAAQAELLLTQLLGGAEGAAEA